MSANLPDLSPCPFCGEPATFEQVDNGGHIGDLRWSAGCNTDGCIGQQSLVTFPRRRDVAAAWNRRATQPRACAQGEDAKDFDTWYSQAMWGNESFEEGCRRAWNAALAKGPDSGVGEG